MSQTPRGGVAAGGDEHVERGVEGEGVDAGEMPVVVPDDLLTSRSQHFTIYSKK